MRNKVAEENGWIAGVEEKETETFFDEITSIEQEHFPGERAPLKFRTRERKPSFVASDRIDGTARRGAGYSRNSKVYSSLERLVVLT